MLEDRLFEVRCTREGDESWLRYERDLDDRAVPIPMDHRHEVVRELAMPHVLISAHEGGGPCLASFAVALSPTRAAPGHVVARAERVGPSVDPWALRAALDGLSTMFTPLPRILRMEVGISTIDAEVRSELGAQLARNEFRRLPEPRGYERTAIIDLGPSEEELFAGLHPTARRHIRAADKRPVRLDVIHGEEHRDAMQALVVETRRRTGGSLPTPSIDELVAVARSLPELLRIVGVFSNDCNRLLAFAAGSNDGDHVTYDQAASTRSDAYRFPLGYAPLWELILWSKRHGAAWFDLGGITTSSHAEDELGGISDFKRYFRGVERLVGEEWTAEPHAVRAAIASRISQVAQWARGTLRDGLR